MIHFGIHQTLIHWCSSWRRQFWRALLSDNISVSDCSLEPCEQTIRMDIWQKFDNLKSNDVDNQKLCPTSSFVSTFAICSIEAGMGSLNDRTCAVVRADELGADDEEAGTMVFRCCKSDWLISSAFDPGEAISFLWYSINKIGFQDMTDSRQDLALGGI